MRLSNRLVLLILFGALALATVLLGALTCHLSGVTPGSWARNLVAWGVGLLAAAGIAFGLLSRPAPSLAVLALAFAAVAATFAGAAQEGVHRWIDLGPLHVNLAFVVLPAAVVALGLSAGRWAWIVAFGLLGLLVVQPDASQATALAAGLVVVAWRADAPVRLRASLIGLAVMLAAASWLRPDPLTAVPEVEEIVALALGLSPALGGAAVVAFGLTAAVPAWTTRSAATPASTAGLALSAYLLATGLMTVLGSFPMPLLGVGMSPVLGFWLGVGLLASALGTSPPDRPVPSRRTGS